MRHDCMTSGMFPNNRGTAKNEYFNDYGSLVENMVFDYENLGQKMVFDGTRIKMQLRFTLKQNSFFLGKTQSTQAETCNAVTQKA